MMESNLDYIINADIKKEDRKYVIHRLKNARSKLTPIVDDIVMNAFDKINNGDNQFISPYTLTIEEYNDILWATQVFRDVEQGVGTQNRKYILPNSEVIVHNVSVSKDVSAQSIIIDEATVLELLQLYENMGVVIQKLINEGVKVTDAPPASTTVRRTTVEVDKQPSKPAIKKSTLSALISTSASDVQRRRSSHKESDEEPTIYIKIQCYSDSSDEAKRSGSEILCAKSCPSRYHVKLDGEPVTVKLNQNADDGGVYCIDTSKEGDDSNIKIVIKQCPECRSTIIGSSTKIRESRGTLGTLGDSHESITLHGKQGDEERMAYSSDEESFCHCEDRGTICISISKVRCEDYSSPCSCEQIESRRKMDVMIDTDSVDRSTVKVRESTTDFAPESPPTSHATVEQLPLTRRRICSSMEFDVTTVLTKLRDQDMENDNNHVVVELKKLGVDQLLRACRPAKCCRKAILNERQRTALPYCVSLKSLPLVNADIDVIKQSIDMSVRRIKNSMDLTQAQKDKLAFYVSLGKDDFRPNINFPWVVPVFGMNLDKSKLNDDRFFVLEKLAVPKQVGSVAKLTRIANKECKPNKILKKQQKYPFVRRHFILMRTDSSSESRVRLTKSKIRRLRRESKRVRFEKQNDCNDESCYMKLLNGSIYKKKNIWTNIGHDDWRFVLTQKHQVGLKSADFCFGKTRVSEHHCYKRPTGDGYEHYEKLLHLTCSKHTADCGFDKIGNVSSTEKPLDSGDCSYSSLSKIFKEFLGRKNLKTKMLFNETLQKKDLIHCKSVPNFWNHISEKLLYASKALGVFAKPSRSLETVENKVQMFKIPQIGNGRWKSFSSQFSDCEDIPSHKLEYYVDLVDGDLVWTNSLPQEPQKYNTYYSHSNRVPPILQPYDASVEVPISPVRVTPDEASQMRSLSVTRNERVSPHMSPRSSRRNSPELNEWQIPKPPKSCGKGLKLPSEFASFFSMGPESTNESWAPLVASESSLPTIKESEEVVKKDEILDTSLSTIREGTETAKDSDVTETKSTGRQDKEPNKDTGNVDNRLEASIIEEVKKLATETTPSIKTERKEPNKEGEQFETIFEARRIKDVKNEPPVAHGVRDDPTVNIKRDKSPKKTDNNVEAYRQNTNRKHVQTIAPLLGQPAVASSAKADQNAIKSSSIQTEAKKSRDITIAIKKMKGGKGIKVEGKAPKPCSKEICELYKNKKLIPEKPKVQNEAKKDGSEQHFTIISQENVEIYINNQKIKVTNNKNKKHAKSPQKDQ